MSVAKTQSTKEEHVKYRKFPFQILHSRHNGFDLIVYHLSVHMHTHMQPYFKIIYYAYYALAYFPPPTCCLIE